MIIDWTESAAQSPKDHVAYLLGEKTSAGLTRAQSPKHVGGLSPKLFLAICGYVQCRSKAGAYDPVVLSFDRRLPDTVKSDSMRSFENMLFPGMSGRIPFLWIEHCDHDRTELHCAIARLDLRSDKIVRPFVAAIDKRRLRLWRKLFVRKHGLPDADERSLLVCNPPRRNPKDVAFRQSLSLRVESWFKEGRLKSRADLLIELARDGYNVTSTSTRFIDFLVEGASKAIRVRGSAMQEDWRCLSLEGKLLQPAQESEAQLRWKFSRAMSRKEANLTKRYGQTGFAALSVIAPLKLPVQSVKEKVLGSLEGSIASHRESMPLTKSPSQNEKKKIPDSGFRMG